MTVNNQYDGSSAHDYCGSIMEAWLNKRDRVGEKGGPYWKTLERALRNELLRQTGIADKIYCKLDTLIDVVV